MLNKIEPDAELTAANVTFLDVRAKATGDAAKVSNTDKAAAARNAAPEAGIDAAELAARQAAANRC